MRQQLHQSVINLATEKQMVSDLKAQLLQAKEVAAVCRDYITMSWGVALDRAVVLADSDLRKIENIFFPEDIHEILGSVPPEEPPSAPSTVPGSIVPEEKGGNEEVQLPAKDKSPEEALTIRDVIAQAREAEPKPSAKGDHPEAEVLAKSSAQDKALDISVGLFL